MSAERSTKALVNQNFSKKYKIEEVISELIIWFLILKRMFIFAFIASASYGLLAVPFIR